MSTNTAQRASTFAYGNGFGFKPVTYKKDSGVLVHERVAVFRSGTFRDSTGYQNTWEDIHMKQMVDNFNYLRNNGVFADVPVRDGHKDWLIANLPGNGSVVGWHTNLVTEKAKSPVDGTEYDYLFADYEITDPHAQEQIANGTWRNRSAEVAPYLTNNEAEFWPVYVGFAFVDIPAVEGLRFSRTPQGDVPRLYVFMNDKETVVPTENNSTTAAPAATGAPAQTDPLMFGRAPQSFSINGASVTDPVAVQSHITALEAFQRETVASNRNDFVTGLANRNVVPATQIDSLQAFANGLTAEQFTQWQATYPDATANAAPALGVHSNVTNPDNTAGQVSNEDKQISAWQATVRMHQQAGQSKEKIEKTTSYKSLVAAGKTPNL